MRLKKYGITLNRLREEDIELVRQWRNAPQIQRYMEFREQISPEQQKEWFKSVDNFNNFYFIIEYQQIKIGLINSNEIEWDTVSSKGGIFLWEEDYYETFVPVWASLCLLETSFFILGASRSMIKTLRDNERAKKLNVHLGYELIPGQETVYNQEYLLTLESFKKHAPKLIKAASLLADQDAMEHSLFFDQQDVRSGLAEFLHGKMNRDMIREIRETKEGRVYVFKPITV